MLAFSANIVWSEKKKARRGEKNLIAPQFEMGLEYHREGGLAENRFGVGRMAENDPQKTQTTTAYGAKRRQKKWDTVPKSGKKEASIFC